MTDPTSVPDGFEELRRGARLRSSYAEDVRAIWRNMTAEFERTLMSTLNRRVDQLAEDLGDDWDVADEVRLKCATTIFRDLEDVITLNPIKSSPTIDTRTGEIVRSGKENDDFHPHLP